MHWESVILGMLIGFPIGSSIMAMRAAWRSSRRDGEIGRMMKALLRSIPESTAEEHLQVIADTLVANSK